MPASDSGRSPRIVVPAPSISVPATFEVWIWRTVRGRGYGKRIYAGDDQARARATHNAAVRAAVVGHSDAEEVSTMKRGAEVRQTKVSDDVESVLRPVSLH